MTDKTNPIIAQGEEIEKMLEDGRLIVNSRGEIVPAETNSQVSDQEGDANSQVGDQEEDANSQASDQEDNKFKNRMITKDDIKADTDIVEDDTPQKRVEKFQKSYEKQREDRKKYQALSYDEKTKFLITLEKEELVKRLLNNDGVLPAKDRTITDLKRDIDRLQRIVLDLTAKNKLQNNEDTKKLDAENAVSLKKKWSESTDENFLADIENEIEKRVDQKVRSLIDNEIKPLKNETNNISIKQSEEAFFQNLTRTVPDIDSLSRTAEFEDMGKLRVDQLPEEISGYLMKGYGAFGSNTVREVLDWSLRNLHINPIQTIMDHAREAIAYASRPSKKSALENHVQPSFNMATEAPKQKVVKTYSEKDIENLNKLLMARKITSEEFDKKLREIQDFLINQRMIKS